MIETTVTNNIVIYRLIDFVKLILPKPIGLNKIETSDFIHGTKNQVRDFFIKCDQIRRKLVTLTEEILNGKLHFLCSHCQ